MKEVWYNGSANTNVISNETSTQRKEIFLFQVVVKYDCRLRVQGNHHNFFYFFLQKYRTEHFNDLNTRFATRIIYKRHRSFYPALACHLALFQKQFFYIWTAVIFRLNKLNSSTTQCPSPYALITYTTLRMASKAQIFGWIKF